MSYTSQSCKNLFGIPNPSDKQELRLMSEDFNFALKMHPQDQEVINGNAAAWLPALEAYSAQEGL